MTGTVLVTGGAGYVGSHCCKAFAGAGWTVVVVDNLSRGYRDAVKWGPLVEADIGDAGVMRHVLETHRPDVVAHFAAYAYVAESVVDPALYYANNVAATLAMLQAMREAGVSRLLFSSTCASYGNPVRLPIDEAHPQAPINPYGWSKLFVERILADYAQGYGMRAMALRYFNAAGCDAAGELGERHEPETHAIPLAIDAARRGAAFTINGTDFDTADGTAVRDYLHVTDLADAHVRALGYLVGADGAGFDAVNLGTGTGTSVRGLCAAVERATGRMMHVVEGPRRPGDPPMLVAANDKAKAMLGWTPVHSDIDGIVRTALRGEERFRATPG